VRRVAVVVVALLLAVEVFVAYRVITDQPSTAAAPTPTLTTATTSAEPEPTPTAAGPTGAINLWFAEDGRLFRSWRGTCSTPRRARLDMSSDAGVTFEEVGLPVLGDPDEPLPETVRAILGVYPEDDQDILLLASDEKCETHGYRTTDGGISWEETDVRRWHVNADGSEVGRVDMAEPGCTALTVVPLRDSPQNAKVLCSDGTVVGTNDDGGEWTVLGELAGAADMTFTSLRDGLAVRRGNACEVEVMDTADAAGSWESISCVLEETDLEPESIAQLGDRVFVQVGGDLYRSDDGGHEWFKADDPVEE